MYKFGNRSKSNMIGVKNDLVSVAGRALEICFENRYCDFGISCGLRSEAEQREMIKKGVSKTMKSRHLTGHAVDVFAVVNSQVDWSWVYYEQIAEAFKQAADELDVSIEWGGDWKSFKDGCHFQLCWSEYPE